MAKLKKLAVADYKMQSKKEQYTDDATDIFNGEITGVIAYLQGILDGGYTHLNSEKWVEKEYGHELAVCETKYYKVREESDEEYEKRCEDHRKRKEKEKVKAEAKKKGNGSVDHRAKGRTRDSLTPAYDGVITEPKSTGIRTHTRKQTTHNSTNTSAPEP